LQNRYAGDIGDFVKLALLRALAEDYKLGVAWYLHPNEGHNGDGRHVSYLERPDNWRGLDPDLFDALAKVAAGHRSVAALEEALGPTTIAVSDPVPFAEAPRDRCSARDRWFRATLEALGSCDLVFADPDNGLVSDEPSRRQTRVFRKQIPLCEALALSRGRCAIIYHHNSRFKGGHEAEVEYWLNQIGWPAIAIRCSAYSSRTFFVINPSRLILRRVCDFCDTWRRHKVAIQVRNAVLERSC